MRMVFIGYTSLVVRNASVFCDLDRGLGLGLCLVHGLGRGDLDLVGRDRAFLCTLDGDCHLFSHPVHVPAPTHVPSLAVVLDPTLFPYRDPALALDPVEMEDFVTVTAPDDDVDVYAFSPHPHHDVGV